MDTESAFYKSLKLLFFLLIFLFFQHHQVAAQKKIHRQKFLGIFPIGKAKVKNNDTLLAYNDKVEVEAEELLTETENTVNNFVLENDFMCEYDYLQEQIIPFLSDINDSLLLANLESLNKPIIKETIESNNE